MENLVLSIAQDLQATHSKEMLGKKRSWGEVSPGAQAVWVHLAQQAITMVADTILAAARTATAPSGPATGPRSSPPHDVPDRSVGATKAAEMLGVDRRTLGRYVANGMPHWYTPGRHLRFGLEEIAVWKAKTKAAATRSDAPRQLTGREIATAEERGREAARKASESDARKAAKRR